MPAILFAKNTTDKVHEDSVEFIHEKDVVVPSVQGGRGDPGKTIPQEDVVVEVDSPIIISQPLILGITLEMVADDGIEL